MTVIVPHDGDVWTEPIFAGSHRALPDAERSETAHQRGVADAHPRHVGDRVVLAGLEASDADPEVTRSHRVGV